MAAALLVLAFSAAAPQSTFLHYVDFQRALEQMPEAQKARSTLAEAHRKRQARIDELRAQLWAKRADLDPRALERESAALQRQADKESQTMETMQARLLSPLVKRLEARRKSLERPHLRIVRLDQVGLIGWPTVCDLTETLLQPKTPRQTSVCEVSKLRLVDIDALASESKIAVLAQADVEAYRADRQAEIDQRLRELTRLEEGVRTDEDRERAAAARAQLDEAVREFRKELDDRKARAEDKVLSTVVHRLTQAAKRIRPVALCEYIDVELGLPTEDGFVWARKATQGL